SPVRLGSYNNGYFGVYSVRSRYGPPGCSPPYRRLLLPGFQSLGHPYRLPGITTLPNWELQRWDLHPQGQKIASLHGPGRGLQALT
ncbi:hypothetical protein, partial [Candidatus Hakubella thermalkaliphila]|uniref:hypothetical protein n=1 Tax=Candidatus Hakubella thermalkaliphila TaxID=2754717 RepID=UPI001C615192